MSTGKVSSTREYKKQKTIKKAKRKFWIKRICAAIILIVAISFLIWFISLF